MSVKLLLNTLQLADGGRVECQMSGPDGTVVPGVIEQAFFEDFIGAPEPQIKLGRLRQILTDNISYFEKVAEQQWQMGSRELVIR